jgi:hypothetical protein
MGDPVLPLGTATLLHQCVWRSMEVKVFSATEHCTGHVTRESAANDDMLSATTRTLLDRM